jgi:hypothetical protein
MRELLETDVSPDLCDSHGMLDTAGIYMLIQRLLRRHDSTSFCRLLWKRSRSETAFREGTLFHYVTRYVVFSAFSDAKFRRERLWTSLIIKDIPHYTPPACKDTVLACMSFSSTGPMQELSQVT